MARSQRSPTINRRDHAVLAEVFGRDSNPAETNATLVPMARLHILKRKGVIDYEEIPEFRVRFRIPVWLVTLTEAGKKLYHP